jgi:hypothetical protein
MEELYFLCSPCRNVISKGQVTDPTSRQRGRPTSTNPQWSDINTKPDRKPQMGALFHDRLAD